VWPPELATVTMYLTVVLGVPDWEGGAVATLNPPCAGAAAVGTDAAAVTTSVAGTVCVRLPLVPVMVTGKLPVGVVAVVLTVSVVEVPAAGFGLRLAMAPLGIPVALKLTEPVKPPEGVILAVKVVLAP